MRVKLIKRGLSEKCKEMWKLRQIRMAKISDRMYILFMSFERPRNFDVIGHGWNYNENDVLESYHIDFDIEDDKEVCPAELHLIPESEKEREFLEHVDILYWCDKYGARIIIASWAIMHELYEKSKPLKFEEEAIIFSG